MSYNNAKRARFLVRVSQVIRPIMRSKTPVLYRLCQLFLKIICPKEAEKACHLIAEVEGGWMHINTSSSMEYHLLFRGCHEPFITDLFHHFIQPGDVCLDIAPMLARTR